MYKSSETFLGSPKRKNDWCEMDKDKSRMKIVYLTIFLFLFIILIVLVSLKGFDLILKNDFSTELNTTAYYSAFIIGTIIAIYVSYKFKRRMEYVLSFSYSYAIRLDFDLDRLGKIIDATSRFLRHNRIAFEEVGDKTGSGFSMVQFHRADNMFAIVGIRRLEKQNDMVLSIYPGDFDDSGYGEELRNRIDKLLL